MDRHSLFNIHSYLRFLLFCPLSSDVSMFRTAYVLLSESSVYANKVCACVCVCIKVQVWQQKKKMVGFWRGRVLGEELFYINRITPRGSYWHNAEITRSKSAPGIWLIFFLAKGVNMKITSIYRISARAIWQIGSSLRI